MKNAMIFIMLKDPIVPDMERLVHALRARHPGLAAEAPKNSGSPVAVGAQSNSVLMCAGMIVAVISVAAPLPIDAGVVARASAMWPEARSALQNSAAHLIVAIMGEQDQTVQAARVTTAVAGGLLDTVPGGMGVVWGGEIALSAQHWAQMSKAAFAPYPLYPSSLWLSLHPFRDEKTGGLGIVTQGLRRFVDRELELIGAADDLERLVTRAEGLAAYLIEKGPVLKDGSTFGISETERMPVRLCTSERFPGLPVISGLISV